MIVGNHVDKCALVRAKVGRDLFHVDCCGTRRPNPHFVNTRRLAEALPHFADNLDLVSLRNVLAALNHFEDCKEALKALQEV